MVLMFIITFMTYNGMDKPTVSHTATYVPTSVCSAVQNDTRGRAYGPDELRIIVRCIRAAKS